MCRRTQLSWQAPPLPCCVGTVERPGSGSFLSETALRNFLEDWRRLPDRTVTLRAHSRSKAGRPQNPGGLVVQLVDAVDWRAADRAQCIQGIPSDSRQLAKARRRDRVQLRAGGVQTQMDGTQAA